MAAPITTVPGGRNYFSKQHPRAHDSSGDDDDDDDPDTFIAYGTPLETIDDTTSDKHGQIKATYLPVWKQQVTDEKGRKRLHGAFKGGFSAGYFNTVGSKEGWTPASFVSSRKERGKVLKKGVKDFMDEEDLEEFLDESRLQTRESFSQGRDNPQTRARIQKDDEAEHVVPKGFMENIGMGLVMDMADHDQDKSIGTAIMRNLGWRPGQGIGARISSTYGKVAPKETAPPPIIHNKQDCTGLGFVASDQPHRDALRAELSGFAAASQVTLKRHPKALPMSGGIGSGILDEDEEYDVYGGRSFKDYDIALNAEHERNMERRRQKRDQSSRLASATSGPSPSSPSLQATDGRCSDGRPPLRGFQVVHKAFLFSKWFPAPRVPTSFKPVHVFSEQENQRLKKYLSEHEIRPREGKWKSLTSSERSQALGETKPTERIPPVDQTPKVDRAVAQAALSGYMPYQNDLPRQERYKAFLEHHAGITAAKNGPRLSETEVAEFARNANMFQPMSNSLALRFASSKDPQRPSTQPPSRVQVPESADVQAAKMGMYGHMTRSTEPWQPSKGLCRAFDVPFPKVPKPSEASTTVNRSRMMPDPIFQSNKAKSRYIDTSTPDVKQEQLQAEPVEEQVEMVRVDKVDDVDMPLQDRPPLNVFEAIFGDSSEEEQEEEHVKQEDVNEESRRFIGSAGLDSSRHALKKVERDAPEMPTPLRRTYGVAMPPPGEKIKTEDEHVGMSTAGPFPGEADEPPSQPVRHVFKIAPKADKHDFTKERVPPGRKSCKPDQVSRDLPSSVNSSDPSSGSEPNRPIDANHDDDRESKKKKKRKKKRDLTPEERRERKAQKRRKKEAKKEEKQKKKQELKRRAEATVAEVGASKRRRAADYM